MERYLTIVHS